MVNDKGRMQGGVLMDEIDKEKWQGRAKWGTKEKHRQIYEGDGNSFGKKLFRFSIKQIICSNSTGEIIVIQEITIYKCRWKKFSTEEESCQRVKKWLKLQKGCAFKVPMN